MKKTIIIAAILAAGITNAQMFAQMFGGSAGTPIAATAWYRLDGSAVDSSGNGYTGTPTTNVSWNSSGKFIGSATIGTSTSYIAIPFTAQSATSGTVCMWVKVDSWTAKTRVFFDTYGGSNRRFRYYITNIKYAELITDSASRGVKQITTLQNGSWHHIALVYGANKLYVDGSLYHTFSTGGLGNSAETMYLGMELGVVNSSFLGDFDDVRRYNRALSAANILRIMTGQTVEPIEELQ